MTLIASDLSTLGIAKETTLNTAVVPANFLRVQNLQPVAHVAELEDDALRGDMAKVHDATPGPTSCEYSFDGPLYADECGFPIAGILADLTVTGASDPYTTTFALLNSGTGQPASYTLTDYNGNNARAFAGCMFSEVSLKFTASGLATISAKALGMSYATASTPVQSYAATTVLPSWECTSSINSSTAAIVTDVQIDIKRTVLVVPALNGSQAPASIWAGGDAEVSVTATVVYDSAQGETVYGYYLNGTKIPLSFDLVQSASREVKAVMSKCVLQDGTQIERGEGKYVTLAVKATAYANATDAGSSGGSSPIKVTTKAQNATGTYK